MKSLRGRLLLAALLVLVLFVAATGLALQRAYQQAALTAAHDRLQGLVYGLLGATNLDDDGELSVDTGGLPDPRLNRIESGMMAAIVDGNGKTRWTSRSWVVPKKLAIAPSVGQWRYIDAPRSFTAVFTISWQTSGSPLNLRIYLRDDNSGYLAQLHSFRRTLWGWLVTLAGLLLLTQYLVLRWVLAPLRRLALQIHALRSGQRERLDEAYPEELQPLAHSINALLDNERGRRQRQREALDNLAHSLKTPLAVLRAQGAAGEPLARMQQLVDYHLSRASAGTGASFAPPLALAEVAEQLAAVLRKLHAERGLTIDIDIPAQCRLRIDRGECMELLGNLLDNAAKWASRRVLVSARRQADELTIEVEDDGPGWPADAERLLQRGVRADSRPGQGIGLAVVSDIVAATRGRIHLQAARRLGGAGVLLVFPLRA